VGVSEMRAARKIFLRKFSERLLQRSLAFLSKLIASVTRSGHKIKISKALFKRRAEKTA
jgi:hypothetical protein